MHVPVIETHNLGRSFGNVVAVKDLNLTIQRGTFFGPVSYTHLTLPTNREV